MSAIAIFVYLIATFLFNDIRLTFLLSWRRNRRLIADRFVTSQARHILKTLKTLSGLSYSLDIDRARTLPSRFILLSNHQSLVDIPLLISAFPEHSFKFVAKKSLRHGVPTLSKCLRYGEHGFVDRKRPSVHTRRELIRLGQLDKNEDRSSRPTGCSFLVFPEGTRSRTGEVLSFYRAGLRLLCETTGLPVVVVALDYGSGIASLPSLLKSKNIHYRMKLLNVCPPLLNRTSVDSLLVQARRDIKNQLVIWRKSVFVATDNQAS